MTASRGQLVPPSPVFATESEKKIWNALSDSLTDGEILIHGLRFTDPQAGEVEIDILLLSPRRGAAIIEVKGGHVEYRDGQWVLKNNGGATRRIHPTDQARRAKHALRRYLDRHPDWNRGLLRTQWFLAFPRTEVVADMGPEAPRSLIIGSSDVANTRAIVNQGLEEARREPAAPSGDWTEQALDLLLHAPDASVSDARFARAAEVTGLGAHDGLVLAGIVLGSLAIAGLGVLVGGLWGLIPAGLIVLGVVALGFSRLRSKGSNRLPVVVAAAVGATLVGGFGVWGALQVLVDDDTRVVTAEISNRIAEEGFDPSALPCHPAYTPCVLQTEWDRNCSDIGFKVRLTGTEDPYRLDRDRNGIGCEAFPESVTGERSERTSPLPR